MNLVQAQIVKEVRAYAIANYETDGWDILVEAYDDAEIVEAIGDATTTAAAIKTLARGLKSQASYRKDIESTAF
jgi:hypothetical protein